MEVHTPKGPIHGWRAFVGEVGIIVLGVLIALAAEQAVQALREGANLAEARDNLRREVGPNPDLFDRRSPIPPCTDRRLDEVQADLAEVIGGRQPSGPLWIGRPQVWDFGEHRFTTASEGGRAALLSLADQDRFDILYNGFRQVREMEQVEQVAWAHLRVMEISPHVDAVQASVLLTALQEARYANFRIKVAVQQTNEAAKNYGFKTLPTGWSAGSASVCVPLHTSRADALAKITVTARRAIIAEP